MLADFREAVVVDVPDGTAAETSAGIDSLIERATCPRRNRFGEISDPLEPDARSVRNEIS